MDSNLLISSEVHSANIDAINSFRKAFCFSKSLNWLLISTRASISEYFSM